jgi:hypothetical protein
MWERSYSKVFKGINKETVWKIWTDINRWPSWHGDLEYCTLKGDFAVGNHFILKPKKAPPVKIDLIDIQDKKEFTDCTKFFGAKMYDTHSLEETEDGLKLSNRLVVTGPLKYFWILLVAKNVASSVPEETEALVKLASKQ